MSWAFEEGVSKWLVYLSLVLRELSIDLFALVPADPLLVRQSAGPLLTECSWSLVMGPTSCMQPTEALSGLIGVT